MPHPGFHITHVILNDLVLQERHMLSCKKKQAISCTVMLRILKQGFCVLVVVVSTKQKLRHCLQLYWFSNIP